MSDYRGFIPLTLLTGFLGSGKTTLLNRWLRDPELADAAVLINEFGEIGLDHQLVEPMDGAPVLLANGCVCCSIRDDLKSAILRLDERRMRGDIPPYKRLLIETTGVADPAPILATLLNDLELRHHYRLGTVVTTIDAVNGGADLRRRPEALKQASVADHLIVTKADLVKSSALDELQTELAALNPTARVTLSTESAAGASLLLTSDVYDPAARAEDVARWLADAVLPTSSHHANGDHGAAHYATLCIVVDEPLDWTAFGVWLTLLLHVHGARALRVKGLLKVIGSDTPVLINGVQHLVHPPFHLARWPDDDHRSRLVFITDGLTRETLLNSLAVFNRTAVKLRPVD